MGNRVNTGNNFYRPEIRWGKTLVDGTGYKIKKGNALVDGVNHNVAFDVTITIAFSDALVSEHSPYGMITTPYGSYNTPAGTYVFPYGTEVTIRVMAQTTMPAYSPECFIKLNGEIVAFKTATKQSGELITSEYLTYVYVAKTDATIECDYQLLEKNYNGDCEFTFASITEH